MNSYTNPKSSSLSFPMTNPKLLLQMLNQLSFLVAIIGIIWYCVLLSSGDYFKWAMPLLIAATACKLLTTSTTPSINRHSNNNRGYNSLREGSSRVIIIPTCYQRIKSSLQKNSAIRKLASIHQRLSRRLTNDNHYNVIFLSTFIIIVPCSIYFINKVIGHLSDSKEAGEDINHKKLANDFGKLGSAGLAFLLFPVSKHSPLFAALGLSEVHMMRLHICSGCVVLFGGIVHGLYHTYRWIKLEGDKFDDVFPTGECWSGLVHRDYSKDCHEKFVNLLGIICGICLLILGMSSLYWIRRKFYRLFYFLHIAMAIILLFGLVMHYNKMIWYMAPSLLCYLASNMPLHVESVYKWWRQRGVKVAKVVCIPDSGGCVELSFRMNDECNREEDGASNINASSFQTFHDTVGRYVELRMPELSTQSHPFSIFTHPIHPSESIRILFRPCGSFTSELSKRLKALTLLPEPTPSEIENHQQTFLNNHNGRDQACPKILVNGIRSATSNMFEEAMVHDRVLIVAGGVGIVAFISLIHALQSTTVIDSMNGAGADEDGENIINNHRRAIYNDEEDDLGEGGFDAENNFLGGSIPQNQKRIEVHWMSRDEGLIRHVVQNYFEPICNRDGGKSSLAINIVVHHTSPHSTASISDDPLTSSNGNSNDETTTWEPSQQHASSHSFAYPVSVYQGHKRSLSQNVLPAMTHASIVFGGIWIVNYCYDNLQDKRVVETRPISVVGLILLSLAVSVVSYAVVILGELFYSKLFAYSKLENSGASAENINSEIECSQVITNTVQQFSIDDDEESNPQTPVVASRAKGHAITSITHSQGRPNLSAIVRDAMKEEVAEQGVDYGNISSNRGGGRDADVGIFMCGPKALSDSVWKGVKEEEKSGLCTKGAKVAVYQEVFEL